MQHLTELDLYDLPMASPEFAADPYRFVAAARAKHPWIARCENGYCVTEYQAIRDLYLMDDKMRPPFDKIVAIMGAENSPWGRFTNEQMIALPDREHRLLRDTFAKRFTPRYANQMRGVMRKIMTQLLDEWTPKRRIDFEDFASRYPVSVMATLIGAPLEAIPGLRHSLEVLGLGQSLNRTRLPELDKAILHVEEFSEKLIEERRKNPRRGGGEPDLLDILIEASDEGGISHRILVDLLIFLFVAGYDTSKNVLTYMMRLMIDHPHIYERCAADAEYARKTVEEALRYFSPGTSFRETLEDIVYRDVLLPKGTMLFLPLSVSGRDATAFEDPDRFDPDRPVDPNRRHITFGLGKHMCLGQHIARAQLQEGLHLVAQRMRNPRLAGQWGWRPFYGVWGLKGLPIEFDPAPASEQAVA